MGVDYSAHAWFGIYGDNVDEIEQRFGPDGDVLYDGTVERWLADRGLHDLKFDVGGNQWSGERYWRLGWEPSMKEVSRFTTSDGVIDLPEPSTTVITTLLQAGQLLHAPRANPGWKLALDVD